MFDSDYSFLEFIPKQIDEELKNSNINEIINENITVKTIHSQIDSKENSSLSNLASDIKTFNKHLEKMEAVFALYVVNKVSENAADFTDYKITLEIPYNQEIDYIDNQDNSITMTAYIKDKELFIKSPKITYTTNKYELGDYMEGDEELNKKVSECFKKDNSNNDLYKNYIVSELTGLLY